jgi:hypothetical protein
MHPMFVKLFLEADDDLLTGEEEKRRRADRAGRNRSRTVMRAPSVTRIAGRGSDAVHAENLARPGGSCCRGGRGDVLVPAGLCGWFYSGGLPAAA